jgi:hypothetical protein
MERVFEAKVIGSWVLHKLSRSCKTLRFFVLFSSMMSAFGSLGQIAHTSACAFQDSLAAYRKRQGLPSLVINWGNWAEIGRAAAHVSYHRSLGYFALTPTFGLKVSYSLCVACCLCLLIAVF